MSLSNTNVPHPDSFSDSLPKPNRSLTSSFLFAQAGQQEPSRLILSCVNSQRSTEKQFFDPKFQLIRGSAYVMQRAGSERPGVSTGLPPATTGRFFPDLAGSSRSQLAG